MRVVPSPSVLNSPQLFQLIYDVGLIDLAVSARIHPCFGSYHWQLLNVQDYKCFGNDFSNEQPHNFRGQPQLGMVQHLEHCQERDLALLKVIWVVHPNLVLVQLILLLRGVFIYLFINYDLVSFDKLVELLRLLAFLVHFFQGDFGLVK